MTSTPDLLRAALVLVSLSGAGCRLVRPPDPPPFDCASIDRAAERFPDECGEPIDGGEQGDGGEQVDGGIAP